MSLLPTSKSLVVWIFGLSGAGKSTLASGLSSAMGNSGHHVVRLDGDELRSGLCSDLGFSDADRWENIRRAAQVAKLLCKSGGIVIASFITPREELRSLAREVVGADSFMCVYLKCPFADCASRDVKGLYAKASQRQIPQFTGIDSLFEEPIKCDLVLDTSMQSVEESLATLEKEVTRRLASIASGQS